MQKARGDGWLQEIEVDGVEVSHTSPFYVTHLRGVLFPGMWPYNDEKKGNRSTLQKEWSELVVPDAFTKMTNGTQLLGLPLYRSALRYAGMDDPTATRWAIGFNSLHDLRCFVFFPAPETDFSGLPSFPTGKIREE